MGFRNDRLKMKQETIRGTISISVLLILYTLIVFPVPFVHTVTYRVSVFFTLVSFGVAAASFQIVFIQKSDAKSRFYGFTIARIGEIYGAVQLAAGILFMLLAAIVPDWCIDSSGNGCDWIGQFGRNADSGCEAAKTVTLGQ